MGIRAFLALAALLSAAACTTPTRSGDLPPLDTEIIVRHSTGSTFRARGENAPALTPEDFDSIVVTFHAIELMPDALLGSVTDHARLFLQSGERGIFMPAPHLVAGSRVGFGPEAGRALDAFARDGHFGRTREIGRGMGIVAHGTNANISLQGAKPAVLPHLQTTVFESLFVDLTESEDEKTYTLGIGVRRITDPPPPLSGARMSVEESAGSPEEYTSRKLDWLRVEAFVLDLEAAQIPSEVYAVVPAPFFDESVEGIVVHISISRPPAAYTLARRQHDRQVREFDVEQDHQEGQRDRNALNLPVHGAVWSGLESALAGLADPEDSRVALAWLARETGATLSEDIALGSSDAAVRAVAKRAHAALEAIPRPSPPDRIGLILEQSSYGVLLDYLAVLEPPPAVVGIILRHTGEVGRHPTVLEEIVTGARSLEELHQSLRRENLILLEDTSPVARVRAYDWLTLTGAAPEGYDPLAPREERREAMNRYLEGLTAGDGEE